AYTTEDLTMTKNLASSARLSTVQENPNTSIELAARTFDGDLNAVSANLRSFHSTGVALLEDTSLKASNKLLQELFSTDGLWRMQLYLQKDSFIEPLTQALKTQFPDMDVFSFQEQEAGALYIGMMSVLYIIGGFFLVLILGTVLLSLVNSLTISTLERATEIGTLRSMGFSVERISSLFAKESVVLSVGACLLGTVVAVAISSTINALNIRFRPLAAPGDVQFVLTPTWWILIGIAIPLVLVSYIAAQIVTKKLMRQRIVSLLSDSGGRK
ncbi:MAG: FtsX-like permease family protein, partial [Bdellovibrio sp.]